MKGKLFLFGIVLLFSQGCTDPPPTVLIVPPEPTPRDVIDNYYFVKFAWGKNSLKDTVVMEVPDDTIGLDSVPFVWDKHRDFMQTSFELKHQYVRDTNGWSAEFPWDNGEEFIEDVLQNDDFAEFEAEQPAIAYHYAPGTYLYKRGLEEWFRDDNGGGGEKFNEYYLGEKFKPTKDEEEEENEDLEYTWYEDIFGISFPWKYEKDTNAFWDIQDYLNNPSLKKGNGSWGIVGTEVWSYELDTLLMWNNDAYSGIVISYIDKDHVEWRSDNPPTFQDGSYIVINELFRNTIDGETYYIIEGEFSVRLYNDNGEYKTAKAGEFRLRIMSDIDLEDHPE